MFTGVFSVIVFASISIQCMWPCPCSFDKGRQVTGMVPTELRSYTPFHYIMTWLNVWRRDDSNSYGPVLR